MSAETKNEVTTVTENYPVLADPEMRAIIMENMGDDELDEFSLEQVKIPGAGSQVWTVNELGGMKSTEELRGIILAFHDVRAYWPGEFSGSEPPECSSPDGKVGSQYGVCKDCPNAQWDSDTLDSIRTYVGGKPVTKETP